VTTPRATASDHAFIVAAYGESPFLESCLQSLRAQTLTSRVLLATSTPCAHIRRLSDRYDAPLYINPSRDGISADWNFALDLALQRYITIAHQDDVYYDTFVEKTLDLFSKHPDGQLCFTGYQEIDDFGQARVSRISWVKHLLQHVILGADARVSPRRLRRFLSFGNPLPCSSVTFDRKRLSDFRFTPDLQSNLDWEAWVRLSKEGAVFLQTPGHLVGRRYNSLTATSRLIRTGVRRSEDRLMFRRLWPQPVASVIAHVYQASYQ
jgi:glycosyltransferase involved in cell wall biosynthesis